MDVRKITTQRRIKEGFISMLRLRKFAECTIMDILSSAEVSKKTFYNYYQDKYDLLTDIEQGLLDGLKSALAADRVQLKQLDHRPDAKEINRLAATAFDATLSFCDEHKVQLARLLSANGDIRFSTAISKIANDEFDRRYPYLFAEPGKAPDQRLLPASFVKTIYVDSIIDLLKLWCTHQDTMSVNDVKRIAGLVQTKSPVELVRFCGSSEQCRQTAASNVSHETH